MLTRVLFLLTLSLSSTFFLTGAWTGSFAIPPRAPETLFVPQAMPLDADIIGSGIDAEQLVGKSLDKLRRLQSGWMRTKIRQTMNDPTSHFVAEGFLQRGPNRCARLEMKIERNGTTAHLVIVSDGEIVARARQMGGAKPVVALEPLPVAAPGNGSDDFLNAKCCGGPYALLAPMHKLLVNAKLLTGFLNEQAVIQIKGELKTGGLVAQARHARIYLDAKTLWPQRLEWWGASKAEAPQLLFSSEFFEPEFDRELSVAECTRVFSYRPDNGD